MTEEMDGPTTRLLKQPGYELASRPDAQAPRPPLLTLLSACGHPHPHLKLTAGYLDPIREGHNGRRPNSRSVHHDQAYPVPLAQGIYGIRELRLIPPLVDLNKEDRTHREQQRTTENHRSASSTEVVPHFRPPCRQMRLACSSACIVCGAKTCAETGRPRVLGESGMVTATWPARPGWLVKSVN